MKVAVINGSPRGEKGNTGKLLKPLAEGMQHAGAQVEVIHLAKYKIQHCLGCFSCAFKTPGKCIIKDDMVKLLPKIAEADITVFASPLYFYHFTGLLKNFLDRTFCLEAANLLGDVKKSGAIPTQAILSEKGKKAFLVACCGFTGYEVFEPLTGWFSFCLKQVAVDNLGAILRPGVMQLEGQDLEKSCPVYYAALQKAGEELIRNGKLSEVTEKALTSTFRLPK